MTRLRGHAVLSERCRATVLFGHWNTTTFTAGLRLSRISAPMLLEGPMNDWHFLAYIEQVLVPTLTVMTVIIDNLSSHTTAGVRRAVEAAGARLLYLPPYSPDFDPIEVAFSKLKLIPHGAKQRSPDDLWDTIKHAMARFMLAECANHFAARSYDATWSENAPLQLLEFGIPDGPCVWDDLIKNKGFVGLTEVFISGKANRGTFDTALCCRRLRR